MQFVRTAPPQPVPQLLCLAHAGAVYRFGLLHTSLEQVPARGAHRPATHAHDVYHVVLYIRGRGRIPYAEALAPFARGSLFVTPPGVPHHYHNVDGTTFAYKELTFALEREDGPALALSAEALLGLYAGAVLGPVPMPVVLNARQTRRLEGILDRVLGAFHGRGQVVWYEAHTAAAEVLRFLVREVYCAEPAEAGRAEDRLEPARQEIELRYRERLSVAELAGLVHLSPGYFQRAFRKAFGTSPIAYQQELRLRAAQQLLQTTDAPVGEIARRVGFGDIYYFSRAFKRALGLSPRAYRQAADQGRGDVAGG